MTKIGQFTDQNRQLLDHLTWNPLFTKVFTANCWPKDCQILIEILMISGSKSAKTSQVPHDEMSSHFWRLTNKPSSGPTSLIIFYAFKTSAIFPNKLPSSMYQLLRAKLGASLDNFDTSTWRTKQKRKGPRGSPCWTPAWEEMTKFP